VKIGVLSDTHVPDMLPELPRSVIDVLSGVDIILHAGDVSDLRVLEQLEPLAQTYAVSGNCESPAVQRFLQETLRLEFANRAIGLIHGHRAFEGNVLQRCRLQFDAGARRLALQAHVLSQFKDVHVIVFGHSHEPYIKMHDGVLLFNPGSVSAGRGQVASVGILELDSNTIRGRIIPI
jgi:uncharacterized protein